MFAVAAAMVLRDSDDNCNRDMVGSHTLVVVEISVI